ncbi:MAG: TetR/AcrR family transcriptional regulator [Alicyclobacillaceae bacterium]|nr:TetR/AcrR family transcriptional regulator [Alicyclobacillaceae bacterium]
MPKVGTKEVRQEQVIEATRRCILEKGLCQLSVKDIAAEAGVSTGIIYHYFKNKEDVLLQVLKESFRKSHMQVMKTVESLPTPREKLEKHMDQIHRVPEDNPDFLRVLVNYIGAAPYHPEIRHILVKFFRNLRAYLDRYLQAGVEEGTLDRKKVEFLSIMVYSFGLGLGIMWLMDPSFDAEEIGAQFKDVLQRYLFEE